MNKFERFVRQEDTILLKLLTAVLKNIFKKIDWENKVIRIWKYGEYLNHFQFTDDILIVIESSKKLKNILTIWQKLPYVALKTNLKKIEVINSFVLKNKIVYKNTEIKQVHIYVYFKQGISSDKSIMNEIKRRIRNRGSPLAITMLFLRATWLFVWQ